MPVEVDKPIEGTYRMKLCRGAPWSPVKLEYGPSWDPDYPDNPQDRSPRWRVWINGEETDRDVLNVWSWCSGEPIQPGEYNYMVARYLWAVEYAPNRPEAHPDKPLNPNTAPVPF